MRIGKREVWGSLKHDVGGSVLYRLIVQPSPSSITPWLHVFYLIFTFPAIIESKVVVGTRNVACLGISFPKSQKINEQHRLLLSLEKDGQPRPDPNAKGHFGPSHGRLRLGYGTVRGCWGEKGLQA